MAIERIEPTEAPRSWPDRWDDLATSIEQEIDNATDDLVLTADDGVTEHRADQASIAGGSYSTVFDLTGAHVLIDGGISGVRPGVRITIDGVPLTYDGPARGRDTTENNFEGLTVPAARSTTSLKVEARNGSGSASFYGWRMFTKAVS